MSKIPGCRRRGPPGKGQFARQKPPKGTHIRHWVHHGGDRYACDIEFIDENGEAVSGTFVLTGWAWAPKRERDELIEALSHPTIAIHRGGA